MADAAQITDVLLAAAGVRALDAVRQAVEAAGGQRLPVAVMAAAGGACPRFCFVPEPIEEPSLAAFVAGADVLAVVAQVAGAQATWCSDVDAVRQHLAAGGAAVVRLAGGWQCVGPGAAVDDELQPIPVSGSERAVALLVGRGEGDAERPPADEIVRRMAQSSMDRAEAVGGGNVACGPVAVDSLRRALSKAAQEGLGKWPQARGWLEWQVRELAAQMLLAAEALRHVVATVPDDRHVVTALRAAAGNFDAAAAFAAGAWLIAQAALGWPERAGTEQSADLDAAHWGVVYEMLRQTSYHWRSAAGWLTRELVRIQSLIAD